MNEFMKNKIKNVYKQEEDMKIVDKETLKASTRRSTSPNEISDIFNEFFNNLKLNEQNRIIDVTEFEPEDENELIAHKDKLTIITRLFRVKKRDNKELIMEYQGIFYKYKNPCIFLKSSNEWYIAFLDEDTLKPELELLRRDKALFEKLFINVHDNRPHLFWDSKPINEVLDFDGRSRLASRDRSLYDFKCYLKYLANKAYSCHNDFVNDIMNYLTEVDSCSIL
jgi:hypothetical protein